MGKSLKSWLEKGGIVQHNTNTSLCAYIPILERATGIKDSTWMNTWTWVLQKEIKNQAFASYELLHMTCHLYYIVSPGAAPLNTSLAAKWVTPAKWDLHYLTLKKRKHTQGNLFMWQVMLKIVEKDHRGSNPGWNPGSDPSSNFG